MPAQLLAKPSEAGSDKKLCRVPHAIHGAKLAWDICPVLALLICGHHTGLPSCADLKQKCRDSTLKQAYEEVKRYVAPSFQAG